MEAVHPLVRRFAGGLQLVAGALGNLVIAQIAPLALRPLAPFDSTRAQELGVDRCLRSDRWQLLGRGVVIFELCHELQCAVCRFARFLRQATLMHYG
ncbi:hypothetical protein FQZ97_1201410 [compost metagenome]